METSEMIATLDDLKLKVDRVISQKGIAIADNTVLGLDANTGDVGKFIPTDAPVLRKFDTDNGLFYNIELKGNFENSTQKKVSGAKYSVETIEQASEIIKSGLTCHVIEGNEYTTKRGTKVKPKKLRAGNPEPISMEG